MANTPDADHPVADVANMIQVTFIESFVWGDDEDHRLYDWLSQFFGPRMLALTRQYIDIYPDEASSFVAKHIIGEAVH